MSGWGTCKFSLKSTELQKRSLELSAGFISGISISSVLSKGMFLAHSGWQDCVCSKGENYFESSLPVIGSIPHCGKPRRARQWKPGGCAGMRLEKWIHVANFRYL